MQCEGGCAVPVGAKCLREPVYPRKGNIIAWEVFCMCFGDTEGMTDAPVDMILVSKTLEDMGLSGAERLEARSLVKQLSYKYREMRKLVDQANAEREEFKRRYHEART